MKEERSLRRRRQRDGITKEPKGEWVKKEQMMSYVKYYQEIKERDVVCRILAIWWVTGDPASHFSGVTGQIHIEMNGKVNRK